MAQPASSRKSSRHQVAERANIVQRGDDGRVALKILQQNGTQGSKTSMDMNNLWCFFG